MFKRFMIGFVVGIVGMYFYLHHADEKVGGAKDWHAVENVQTARQVERANQRATFRELRLHLALGLRVHGEDIGLEPLGLGDGPEDREQVRAVFGTGVLLNDLLFRQCRVPVRQDA